MDREMMMMMIRSLVTDTSIWKLQENQPDFTKFILWLEDLKS